MPASIIKSFAEKTGKTIAEVEKLWNQAKESATTQGQKDNYAYITGILKKMLNLNEDATVTGDIATVPKRLGEKPVKQGALQYDGNLSGYPYFNIKEVGDYMKVSSSKRMNQKIQHNDERINRHLKENGGPFLLKYGNYTIKLTKKDF